MASKTPGTPSDDPKTDPKTGADYDAKSVAAAPADETIDAEIVDTDGDGRPDTVVEGTGLGNDTLVGDDTVIGAGDADDGRAERASERKKGGIGFGAVLAALVLVALVAGYFLFVAGDDEDAMVASDAGPGVVVTDAEPFPGNELDAERPIRGAAAPGTREAAIEADAASGTSSGDDAELTPVQRRAIAAAAAAAADLRTQERGGQAMMQRPGAENPGAGDRDTETTQASANEASEDEAEEDGAASEGLSGVQDDVMGAVADARADDDQAASRDERSATERMAAMVGRDGAEEADGAEGSDAEAADEQARGTPSAAELLRQRREAAIRACGVQGAAVSEANDRNDDPNAIEGMTRREPSTARRGADDPNALSGGDALGEDDASQTSDRDVASEDDADRPSAATLLRRRREAQRAAGEEDAAEPQTREEAGTQRSAIERLAERRRARQEDRDAPAQAGEGQDASARGEAAPQLVDPRPAVVAVPRGMAEQDREADAQAVREAMQAREAEQEAQLDQRFDQVRTGIRQDVLAEAEQVIERAIAETEREVQELRAALGQQEQRSDARIAQLQDRLEVLQNRDASSAQQGVVILALSSLGSEIDQGRPFTRQLEDVERLIPNARSLRALSPSAAAGIPTEPALRERFSGVARQAQSAARRAEAQGPFDKLWANITGLFSVRERGEPEGDTPSAVISRAEAALERGDLAGATQELGALEGEAAEAFAGWRQDAALRVDAQDRIDSLERAVLAPAR